MNPWRLAHDVAHAHARVQRGIRVLKDHLNLQGRLARVVGGHLVQGLAAELDVPVAGLQDPRHHPSQSGLAAS